MNILRNSFLALLSLTFVATTYAGPVATPPMTQTVVEREGGPYVTITGGALWLEDASAYGISLDFDTGFSVLGAVGYSFGNGLAVEIESGYMEVDSAEVHGFGLHADVDGDFRQVPIIANVVYNVDIASGVSFYIGAGAGIVWSEASVDRVAGFDVSGAIDEKSWNFAAQAKAGLSFRLCEAASLNVGYRYFYGRDAVGDVDDAQGSIAEAGITIRF
jgi:opacity protein-like surface antigen